MIKIYSSNINNGINIANDKSEIMRKILNRCFASKEVIDLIKSGEFNFTIDDIKRIIDADVLLNMDACHLMSIYNICYQYKSIVLSKILNGYFLSNEVIDLIKSGEFDFTIDDIKLIIDADILLDSHAFRLMSIYNICYQYKSMVLTKILNGYFLSKEIIDLIKSGEFNFTIDDIKLIIDANVLSDKYLEKLGELIKLYYSWLIEAECGVSCKFNKRYDEDNNNDDDFESFKINAI
jgi:hypothetical protein